MSALPNWKYDQIEDSLERAHAKARWEHEREAGVAKALIEVSALLASVPERDTYIVRTQAEADVLAPFAEAQDFDVIVQTSLPPVMSGRTLCSRLLK